MDARQFIAIVKHNSVDWSADSILKELTQEAILPPPPPANDASLIQQGISASIHARKVREYERAQWFQQLTANDRQVIAELLRESSEKAIFSVLTIIDGVAVEVPGAFEITEIDGDDRRAINQENSEMLHDLFSDLCEAERL